MVDYAVDRGIPPELANRAIRQLFLGAGISMSDGAATPADHVRQMIDYAGTTAAGLEAMKRSTIAAEIAEGLDAAVSRTRSIG
jgi:pyrroline-5-carboxylate reductase